MDKKEIIELYLADLNNLLPDSAAKRNRIIDLEDELQSLSQPKEVDLDELRKNLEWIKNEYIQCVNDGDAILDTITLCINQCINSIPQLQKPVESEWINVDDRLPENREIVIIYWNYEGKERITSGSYNSNSEYWQHGSATQLKVTHWMPLPQPPKPNSNN